MRNFHTSYTLIPGRFWTLAKHVGLVAMSFSFIFPPPLPHLPTISAPCSNHPLHHHTPQCPNTPMKTNGCKERPAPTIDNKWPQTKMSAHNQQWSPTTTNHHHPPGLTNNGQDLKNRDGDKPRWESSPSATYIFHCVLRWSPSSPDGPPWVQLNSSWILD